MERIIIRSILIIAAAIVVTESAEDIVQAATPDAASTEAVMEHYSVLLKVSRDGCAYFLNPDTVHINESGLRAGSVVLVDGSDGTSCNGMFRFETLAVNCQAESVSFFEAVGSPATWQQNFYRDPDVAAG